MKIIVENNFLFLCEFEKNFLKIFIKCKKKSSTSCE
jgi:hypothetical protein